MPRPRLGLVPLLAAVVLSSNTARPADPDKAQAVTQAMADARAYMLASQPADAVAALEKAVPYIDGNPAFLALLNQAYRDELKRLRLARTPDDKKIAAVKEKLDLLAERVRVNAPPKVADLLAPVGGPPAAETPADQVRRAIALFKEAGSDPFKYAEAASLFARAMNSKVEMTADQRAAWAYCRVRVAAERFNQAKGDPAVAAEVAAEVEDALKLAPDQAKLQQFGQTVLAAAGVRKAREVAPAGGRTPPEPQVQPAPGAVASPADGVVLEFGSFRVRSAGPREFAEAVAKKAQEHRAAIFARWSGPPGGEWQPVCELVVHPTAAAFAAATKQPAAATGHAHVKLDGGRAVERRIDLRADDETLLDDALPRELTHVVVADLFPAQAPPRWAEEAMAVLATSPGEVERYLRTVSRCARGGELIPVASLLDMKGLPTAERITGFYVESVSLVDFMVRWKKEKAFTTFLRDYLRYGPESALKRQYDVNSPRQLEDLWRRDLQGTK